MWYPGKRLAEWIGWADTDAEKDQARLKNHYAALLNNPEMSEEHRQAVMQAYQRAAQAYDPAYQLLGMQTGGMVKPPQYDAMFQDPMPANWDQLRGRNVP